MHRSARKAGRHVGAYALVCLFLLTAFGCGTGDFRPKAIGQEGEIVVVVDSSHWNSAIGEALKETVGQWVGTLPAPERQFDLRQVDLVTEQDLEMARRHKNVIFVAPLNDTTNEALYIKNVFDSTAQAAIRQGQGAVVSRKDMFRRDQQIFYITGADTSAVVDAIHRRSDELSGAFNRVARQRLTEDMFEKGRQRNVEEQLMEEHGFAVNVQHDYQIAIDTTNFVWLRRILSETWRSLFVYYIEDANPGLLSAEWIYDTRDSLTRKYVQGNLGGWVEIDRREVRPLETENIDFLGRYGFETRGLWHMVGIENGEKIEFGMGGPFLTYTFYDQPTGRIYMIDGMVFAPGYNKREFLRQMEAIAHTFRTQAETTEGAVASNE